MISQKDIICIFLVYDVKWFYSNPSLGQYFQGTWEERSCQPMPDELGATGRPFSQSTVIIPHGGIAETNMEHLTYILGGQSVFRFHRMDFFLAFCRSKVIPSFHEKY